jgi:hypothetical protein
MADYNDFVSSIDNHNIANGDKSWLERKSDSIGELATDIGQGIFMGGPSAVVAGVNSILNSGIAVGNFLGADMEPISTYKVLAGLDSNLSDYYMKHTEGVEIAGFALGMFVPGTAGVKALNAAKAGFLGTNMAKSSGLMMSLTRDYATLAKAELAASNAPFSILSKTTLQSLAQGMGASVLEMGAFNTAVAATMFKSPLLEEQSIGDLFRNDIRDTIIFGGIGGVFKGFQIYGQITKAGKVADQLTFPYKSLTEVPTNASPLDKVLTYFNDKFTLPEAMGPLPNIKAATGLSEAEGLALITKERAATLTRLDEKIRQHLNEFAKGDVAIGNQLFEATKEAKNFQQIWNALGNAQAVGRLSKNETVAFGDILSMEAKLTGDDFLQLLKNGEYDKLLVPATSATAQGYRITGSLADLRITSVSKDGGKLFNREQAFADGYDIVRNTNGTLSVNPQSKILQSSALRRQGNDRILDLSTGMMVEKATPGLADLATKESSVMVRGETVMAGNLNPIKVGKSEAFNPVADDYLSVQARTIWAQNDKTKIKWDGLKISENDLPLLERFYQEEAKIKAETSTVYLRTEEGLTRIPRGEALKNYIIDRKATLAKELDGTPLDEMALRLNVEEKFLADGSGDWMKLKLGDDFTQPRYAKVTYADDDTKLLMMNPNNHTGALEYARQIQVIKEQNLQNFANFAKEDAIAFPDAPNWLDPGRTPTREGAGASLFGFANANFGSVGGWAQTVAQQVDKMLLKRKTQTAESLNLSIGSIRGAQLSKEATAETALINNRLLQSAEGWKFHPDGSDTLITRSDFMQITKNPNYVPENAIKISNESVADFWRNHININGGRQQHVANMKGAAGIGDDFDPSVLYPVPVDTTKLKHFVMVKPLAPVTNADKMRVIAAKDEATLQKLIAQVDQNEFKVITKNEGDNWHKAIGDYEYALGLNQSAVDSALKREGKLSQHFPTVDENFFDRVMDWHMRQEEVLTHSMVYHRYSQSFEELKNLGERYTNIATSQFRSVTERLEKSVKDPYNDVVRTALNISRSSEYQPWINFNSFIRDSIEQPINKLRNVFANTKEIDQTFVDTVNTYAKEMGQGQPFKTAMDIMIANGNVPNKPWAQQFVAKANALLSTTLLQWDTFNAINNTVSTAIIAAPEMQKLLKGIQAGNPEIAGKLKDLMSVVMPDGSGITLPTTRKLLFNAHNAFTAGGEAKAAMLERFEKIGAINTLGQEMRQMLDSLTLNYEIATAAEANKGLQKAVEFGRKWTGNSMAEQYTRFISAHMAMEIGDLGQAAKVITRKEADELISLFTNRTQGNYLYSQRPIVFQGVVGQAIGLFQTYQFNLMQQLFKHVAEGDGKATALLMGLQGGIYGMQGLPAFNFLNTHVVGNANGNTQHKDLYSASYTVFGKALGDWMLYGAGSNAVGLVDPSMRFNLYSRGDINPRQITVLPTNITDIPMVAASTKFIGNILNAFGKAGNGADIIPTITQAIEHNGISRPLAGLAQIVQGYTTNNAGGLLTSAQDMWQISTLTRLGGAKPFDESLALDALYRINAYKAKDTKDMAKIGSAIKTTVIAGGNPSAEQIDQFAAAYVKNGGRIEGFNKYFASLMTQANRSQVNAISENLQNPMAKNMQIIMGGTPLPDFTSTSNPVSSF